MSNSPIKSEREKYMDQLSPDHRANQPSISSVGPAHFRWGDYASALGMVVICALIARLMFPYFAPADLIMVYLVGVIIVAARYGRGPSVFASVLSVLTFDFFFVAPHLTFVVADQKYLVTFLIMLLVALTISDMTARIKRQAEVARERERRTTSLYELSRDFAQHSHITDLAWLAVRHIENLFDGRALLFLPDEQTNLHPYGLEPTMNPVTEAEHSVACWVYQHSQTAGLDTPTLPGVPGLYLPLLTGQGTIGVLALFPASAAPLASPDQRHLLETFANQTALALERARLTTESEDRRVQIEAERLRNSLLSSVSHDLRTPLAAITGAASSLLQRTSRLDLAGLELAQVIYEEAQRLNRFVGNLLEMTRLESGRINVNKEWQPLEEVVGTTLLRLDPLLTDHPLTTRLAADLPLVPIDGVLIEQVLVNLLENAVKYTPCGTPIELSAWPQAGEVMVEVADHGPGLPPGAVSRVFEKFYRIRPAATGGVGLGLAICRALVEAHGGRIWADKAAAVGAVFRFTLPLDGEPPSVELEEAPGSEIR